MSKAPVSGMESMMRSLGLGEVLDAAKGLVESGAVHKIVRFADGLEMLDARLTRIEDALARIASGGASGSGDAPCNGQLRIAGPVTGPLPSVGGEPSEPGRGPCDAGVTGRDAEASGAGHARAVDDLGNGLAGGQQLNGVQQQ